MAADTFCAVPWLELSTKPNGNIRICCLMTNSKDPDKGVLRDQNNNVYTMTSNPQEALNAQKAKQLRVDLLRGHKSELCMTCWQKEEHGMSSKRTVTNKKFKHLIDSARAKELTGSDGSISDFKPAYLDLRLGNLCNLKCVMCHPASSSKWYSDYVQLTGKTFFKDTRKKMELQEVSPGKFQLKDNPYNWHEQEAPWKYLDQVSSHIEQVYLVGGEPLLIEKHYNFIQSLIEKGLASKITLEYDTNLTYLPEKVFALWENFKKVLLRVSLEGTEEVNNYIRFPSNWERIKSNIERVRPLDNIQLEFSSTWQIYNLFSISKVWDYFDGQGSVRILTQPSHLSVLNLPRKLKEGAVSHFKKCKHTKLALPLVHFLEKNMSFKDPKQLNEFLNYTTHLDKLRNLDFKKIEPEIYSQILNETRKEV